MKDFFLVGVALVIPLFFAIIYVMSFCTRLGALRRRCREGKAELQSARDEAGRDAARAKWTAASAAYEKARWAFPGRLFAALFRFAPAESIDAAEMRKGSSSDTTRSVAD